MAGRRGGKTLWEEWEVFAAGQGAGLPAGWFAPTYKILQDAFRDIQERFAPFVGEVKPSENRLQWRSGAWLEFWSLDSDVVARSRKYGLAVIDEAGLVGNLEQRWRADIEPTLLDLDGRGVFGSTPNLVGPEFTKLFARGVPANSEWASFRWSSLDNPHLRADVGKRIEQLRREGVPEWVLQQEYFAVPAESDRSFFRQSDIEAHKLKHGREPIARGVVDVLPEWHADRFAVLSAGKWDRIGFKADPSGALRVWEHHKHGEQYSMGVDLGYGVGSSNTVFSVGKRSSRTKIAEYAWPGVTPDEAAMLAAALAWHYQCWGLPAWVCFERNGPGEMFAKRMHELEFPALWFERKTPTALDYNAVTMKYGWTNTAEQKEYVLGNYRAAMVEGKFVNPSIQALDECGGYLYDDQMRLTSTFERTKQRDDPARVKHGDRVIADALLNLCFDWTPPPSKRGSPLRPDSLGKLAGLDELLPELYGTDTQAVRVYPGR